MNDSIYVLLLNSLLYLVAFIIYQWRKSHFDIGSALLGIWVVASMCSVWYYTMPLTVIFYPVIKLEPLLYLFVMNMIIMYPMLRVDYTKINAVDTYNLAPILKYVSIFFGIMSFLPFLNMLYQLKSMSLGGAFLASMYSSDTDTAELLFIGPIKPFYSIVRHFQTFIVFLFFYNISLNKKRIWIILGLAMSIAMFFIMSILSGSRGAVLKLLVTVFFFAFFMRHMIPTKYFRVLMRVMTVGVVFLALGIAAITVSRLDSYHKKGRRNRTMEEWVSQYAGEGMVRFDYDSWNIDKTLNGKQNLPIIYAFNDPVAKDVRKYASRNERLIGSKLTMFNTYMGDLCVDFGKFGGALAVCLMSLAIYYLTKRRNNKISLYKLVILSFFFNYLVIGFTANVYRGYYNMISIVYELILLGLLYLLQISTSKSKR